MATLYAKAAGGNYSAAGTWSNVSSAGVDNSGPPTSSDDVIFDAGSGNVTVDAASVAKTITCTGYTGTLTHNAFTLTVSGSILFVAGMTYTPLTTSIITMNTTGTLTTGGKLLPVLNFTDLTGNLTLGDNLSFMAARFMTLTLSNTMDMAGFTISGNSSINRILLQSSAVGTARVVTLNGGTFANADLMDMTISSPSDVDLSAITGLSGDCGGNSITGGGSVLTFTASSTQTATGTASFTWSTHGWTSRVPLPQDDVVVNNSFIAGRTVTIDMPRLGRSLDFSGLSGSPTLAFTTANGVVGYSIFGSLTLTSGCTFSHNQTTTFRGRGSYSLTSATKTFGASVNFTAPGGTYTLQDTYAGTVNSPLLWNNGTFISGNNAITAATFTSSGSTVRTVTLGTSTLTELATSGTDFNFATTTNLTFSGALATFVIGSSSASTRTFAGGGLTFGTLTYTIAGSTGQLNMSGSNTFTTINFSDVTNARTLAFTAGTTTTVSTFNVVGTSGKLMSVSSITAATHTLASNNQQSTDYLSLTNSIATGNRWFAGVNSVDNGGNSGWRFTAPTSGSGSSGGSGGLQSRKALQNVLNLT